MNTLRPILTPFIALALAGTGGVAELRAAETAPVAPTAQAVSPIAVGSQLPDGPVVATDGTATTLHAMLNGQPSVLVVFRGGWCPYCTRHLAAIGQQQAAITAAGYQVVGISPDAVESLAQAGAQHSLPYQLAGDPEFAIAKALGLAFTVDAQTVAAYDGYGIPLRSAPGSSDKVLPVPAVVVVDGAGVVQFVHADPEFRRRLAPADLLAALGG